METKAIALIIVFSALAIVLNPTISRLAIPVFYIPNSNLVYQFFEIPIVAALLLLGFRSGLAVAALNSLALVFLYPGRIFLYPVGNFVAVTSMMIGIYLAIKLFKRKTGNGSHLNGTRIILFSTALGIALRIAAMTPVWYVLFRLAYPTQPFSFFLTTAVPLEAVFNATLPLYTIPIGYLVARIIGKNLKVGNTAQSSFQIASILENWCISGRLTVRWRSSQNRAYRRSVQILKLISFIREWLNVRQKSAE